MRFFRVKDKVVGAGDAELPVRGSKGASGYDLAANEDGIIFTGQQLMISTGIGVMLPPNTVGIIHARSKLANKFGLAKMAGVVDFDYTGEVKVILINNGDRPFLFEKGDKIAQLVVSPVYAGEPIWSAPEATERGDGGIDDEDLRLR